MLFVLCEKLVLLLVDILPVDGCQRLSIQKVDAEFKAYFVELNLLLQHLLILL